MTPVAPAGYVLIPEQVFSTFVAIVLIACVLKIVFALVEYLNESGR